MKYASIISIIFHICSCVYVFIGAYVHVSNFKSRVNGLYLFLASSMSGWAFAYGIANSAPTAEASAYWRSFGILGLGAFYSVLLHFLLILTYDEKLSDKRYRLIILIPIYLPAVINIALFSPFGLLADTQYIMVQSDFGWINVIPVNAGEIWLNSYCTLYLIASVALIAIWLKKKQRPKPYEGTDYPSFIILDFYNYRGNGSNFRTHRF